MCVRVLCYSLEVPSKLTYSHVATWANKYLDSGAALPMDTAESLGSDYDSDDSRSSVETVHHSYSCVPSDVEVGGGGSLGSVDASAACALRTLS